MPESCDGASQVGYLVSCCRQSDDYPFNQDPGYTSSVQSYAGRRAISQQVTLGVLLGAGSFGRVYRCVTVGR